MTSLPLILNLWPGGAVGSGAMSLLFSFVLTTPISPVIVPSPIVPADGLGHWSCTATKVCVKVVSTPLFMS